MSRLGRIALATVFVASICLNLVVAGFVAERAFDRRSSTERASMRAANAVLGRLPDEVRMPLLDAIAGRGTEIDAAIRAVRRSRRDLRAAMRAEPLDQARLQAALDSAREQSQALLSIINEEIARKLPDIPAADRAKIRAPATDD